LPGLEGGGPEALERWLIRAAWEPRQKRRKRQEKAARARQAEGLLDFIEYHSPRYRAGWFHREVCRIFEKFLADVLAGKRPRVILTAPPQFGKSEIVSRNFPCWAQGRVPSLKFICSSYASGWAESLSSDRLKIFASAEYSELFPDLRLTRRRAHLLENAAGGFMLAAGVDAGITGRSSDIGIIDDPIKGYADAVSPTYRERLKNWYRTDFYSRLQEGAGVIAMATRWHEDDLIGWLIEQAAVGGGDQWEVHNYTAIAEADELHRKMGESLSVERYDEEALAAIKTVQGTYAWNALYQGRPAPAEGLMLKRENWRYYGRRADGQWDLPNFDIILLSADCSFKDNPDSDHVAIHVWGFVGARGYLIGRTCERMGYTATKSEITRLAKKHRADTLLIEDAANGSAVIEELSRAIGAVTVIGINPLGGKIARAWPFSADLEAGNAWLPEGEELSGDIVTYAAKFPNTSMDHDIDAITQAFTWRREQMHGLFAFYESEAAKLKQDKSAGLAKVQVAKETPACPNPACGSLAVRVNPDGSGLCNQCGGSWPSPGGDENAELGGYGRAPLLK
jgi:predicted phage terminase large subunit-like protein